MTLDFCDFNIIFASFHLPCIVETLTNLGIIKKVK